MRVREEGEEVEGREKRKCEREREFGEKGKKGKRGNFARSKRGGRRQGSGRGGGVEAYPQSTPSCMLKCVPCVCLFMRMLTL